MANTIKIKAGSGTPTTSNIVDRELAFDRSANKLYINDNGSIVDLSGEVGDITAVTAGTGLDGGGSSGDVSLSVDVSDFMSNGADDRILTATGADAMNAEANLTFSPSNNYLTVHEAGSSTGSHLRLATDNSDFILTAGGSSNQLSIYDVTSASNRLVINSAGAIATGVWQGTAIASAYLDADTAHLSGTQTFSGSKTFSSHVILPDNVGLLLGAGNKFQVKHLQ
jgi:hypothetical protein